jgi:hypothetical protein
VARRRAIGGVVFAVILFAIVSRPAATAEAFKTVIVTFVDIITGVADFAHNLAS